MSKLHKAKYHVNVRLDMDELDLTVAESKATYEEIKSYVAEHNDGMKVSNLYIAQVKAKYGIIERENYNKAKSDDARQPQCPKEKKTKSNNYLPKVNYLSVRSGYSHKVFSRRELHHRNSVSSRYKKYYLPVLLWSVAESPASF